MDNNGIQQQERAFLNEQLVEARHKIARLENVRSGCHNCPEADGLDALLSAAATERHLIEDLIERQQSNPPASDLSALIMGRIHRLEDMRRNGALRWRRGRPTPPAYWEAANQRNFLEQLLRRWHAWQAGRPYYPAVANGSNNRAAPTSRPTSAPARANPWDAPSALPASAPLNGNEDPKRLLALNETRRAELLAALERVGIAPDHVEIIFASDQMAYVIAYAHNEHERQVIINTILASGYAEMLMEDIRVRDPRWCPACRARETSQAAPPPQDTPPPSR